MLRKLCTYLLALTMGCTSVGAERGYTREVRLRPLDLDHPVDVNTDYTLAISEGLGYLEDRFTAGNNHKLTRFGKAVAMLWIHGADAYWSHEMAHGYNVKDDGERGWEFENETSSIGLPRVDFKGGTTTLENTFDGIAGGLNQSENNALELWKRTDTITLDRALSFLSFKLDDTTYNFRSDLDAHEDGNVRIKFFNRKPGKNEYLYAWPLPKETELNDLDQIGAIYKYWDAHADGPSKIEKRAAVADFLTFRTWESFWSIWRYLRSGERTTKTLTFDVAGHKVSPPLVGSYLTHRGVIYNASFGVDGNVFSVGRNVDLPDWRVGVKLGEMERDCFSLSPFAAFNRIGGRNGFTIGSDIGFEVGDNASLVFTLQRSEDDVIENDVRTVTEGTDVQVGLRVKW